MRSSILLLTAISFIGVFFEPTTWADEFVDDFSASNRKDRQALRGEWKFADNVASCTADPVLYKKFKNHGPILRWPVEMTDGTVEFEFRAIDVQRLVFTFNEKGHVFRTTLRDDGNSAIFGWIGQSSKENKPKNISRDGVPSMKDLNGKLWAVFKMTIQGDEAEILIGNYHAKLQHPSIARKKGEVTISFASGKFLIRDFKITH